MLRSIIIFLLLATAAPAVAAPDYTKDVAPLLRKYCAGCHNSDDQEGGFSLETHPELLKGGEHGTAVTPGVVESSRMLQMMRGKTKPQMPPEGEPAPDEAAISLIAEWITAGASGPGGNAPDRTTLLTPDIKPLTQPVKPVTAMAWSADGNLLAVATFGQIELKNAAGKQLQVVTGLPGKVNAVSFSPDGKQLIAASGVAGLYGKAVLIDTATGKPVRTFQAHRDTLYAAELSPAGDLLATAGYDRRIILWDTRNGKQLRTLAGHNDAIYDLAFNRDASILASASGDETIKIWRTRDGVRLDTLPQPLAEQYAVAFSPDDQFIVAGGADNRLRVWRLLSRKSPQINPLVHARFAHEGAIQQVQFSASGASLITTAADATVKQWETRGFTETRLFPAQPDVVAAMAISPTGRQLMVGRMNGSTAAYAVAAATATTGGKPATLPVNVAALDKPITTAEEQEPNNTPAGANAVSLPVTVSGVIGAGDEQHGDLYRIQCKAGQQWIMEIEAARKKSPLDSRIQVLSADGKPVQRLLLEAVRDSYFTFRGKDSNTSNDFRVHNWREMELNEYLYSAGEVVKLFMYPRGPDSGFNVYPGSGKRHTFFDTSPLSHALQAPCYIVKPHPPGAKLIANGLPVFPLYYENDDESTRKLGSDSRLTFTAPADGEYLVRVADVRGFAGDSYKYKLTIRQPAPDFSVRLGGAAPTVNAGSGKEFTVTANRVDGFDGDIRVDISGVPPGFHVTTPLIIQAGHSTAAGCITADADAPQPTKENAGKTVVTATALINSQKVQKPVNNLGAIKLGGKPALLLQLLPDTATGAKPAADDTAAGDTDASPAARKPWVLELAPGETVTAIIRASRDKFKGDISFGKEDSGRNLPHGVYVDNIGLNGLLIPAGQTQRQFFITAANWVPETTRTFHLRTGSGGGQATWPVTVKIRKKP